MLKCAHDEKDLAFKNQNPLALHVIITFRRFYLWSNVSLFQHCWNCRLLTYLCSPHF